jgi:hypothetical protein
MVRIIVKTFCNVAVIYSELAMTDDLQNGILF